MRGGHRPLYGGRRPNFDRLYHKLKVLLLLLILSHSPKRQNDAIKEKIDL